MRREIHQRGNPPNWGEKFNLVIINTGRVSKNIDTRDCFNHHGGLSGINLLAKLDILRNKLLPYLLRMSNCTKVA